MIRVRFCLCGCKGITKPGNRFVKNHHSRLPENREKISKALSGTRMGGGNPFYGKTHSEETKLRWKTSRVYGPIPEEIRRKISETQKGKELTKEHKEAIKKATLKAMQNPEIRKKISDKAKGRPSAFKGRKHTPESLEKLRQSKIGKVSGPNNPRFGYRYTEEEKEKHSKRFKELGISKLDKNPNWKGGSSFEDYSLDWTQELKRNIRKRDKHKCQNPYCINGLGRKHIHHIDYDKKNCNPNNLITLCLSCHSKANFNRKYWERVYRIVIFKKRIQKYFE